jgi:hypothetical protein
MLKTFYAIAAAAVIAACLVLSPSLTPQVEAGCLRDTSDRLAEPREVRFVQMNQRPTAKSATIASR